MSDASDAVPPLRDSKLQSKKRGRQTRKEGLLKEGDFVRITPLMLHNIHCKGDARARKSRRKRRNKIRNRWGSIADANQQEQTAITPHFLKSLVKRHRKIHTTKTFSRRDTTVLKIIVRTTIMNLLLTNCFSTFSLLLTSDLLVGLGLGLLLLLSLSRESCLLLRQDGRVDGGGADELVLLPVGALALLTAVSDGHTLANIEVADGGANLAPGWLPVEDLLEQGSLGGRRLQGVVMGKVDGGS